eukprot:gene25442-30721_t
MTDFSSGLLIISQSNQEVSLKRLDAAPLLHNLLKAYVQLADEKGGLGLKKEHGFRELVQKDLGRFDLNLDHLVFNRGSSREFLPEEKAVIEVQQEIDAVLKSHLQAIFGDLFILNAFGAVISKPGTEAQRWHVDSSHLFHAKTAHEEQVYSQIPCHFVTVFCPLFHFSEEIGPTEIALRSFKLTSVLRNHAVEDQYPADHIVAQILADEQVERMKLRCQLGDIVVMDGRTLHRGGNNVSSEDRPLLYLSYCLPWYHEFPRSQNEGRSLFD